MFPRKYCEIFKNIFFWRTSANSWSWFLQLNVLFIFQKLPCLFLEGSISILRNCTWSNVKIKWYKLNRRKLVTFTLVIFLSCWHKIFKNVECLLFPICLLFLILSNLSITFSCRSRTATTSEVDLFVIIVNRFQPLTIITKSSTLDVSAVLDPPL